MQRYGLVTLMTEPELRYLSSSCQDLHACFALLQDIDWFGIHRKSFDRDDINREIKW
jgi:hypothetical protein